MLKIQKLIRPTKRSGNKIMPGERTKQRGVLIVNQNSYPIFVDKFTTKKAKT